MKKMIFAAFAALACLTAAANDNGGIPNTFDKPAFDSLKTLKATVGKPFSAGYVFIDGHYINPPYTVQRYGTVIRINGIQVTGEIVPWGDFVMTQSGAKATRSESTVPAETPAAPEPEPESEEPAEEPEEIGDDDSSLDDLFADEPVVKKKPARKRAVRRPRPAAKPVVTTDYSFEGEFKHNAKTMGYLKQINNTRTRIDKALRKGGYFFFGSRYKALSGNASTAKYVIEKLPPVMRGYSDFENFSNALRSSGLSYLPVALMEDLFRNRINYIMLERRLKSEKAANEWSGGF